MDYRQPGWFRHFLLVLWHQTDRSRLMLKSPPPKILRNETLLPVHHQATRPRVRTAVRDDNPSLISGEFGLWATVTVCFLFFSLIEQ